MEAGGHRLGWFQLCPLFADGNRVAIVAVDYDSLRVTPGQHFHAGDHHWVQ